MRLPPYAALRALEAAARRQSFTLAAEELHVTHGAVSHQIRRLEEELGAPLFRREARRMVPTEAALQVAAAVAQATRLMERAVSAVGGREQDRTVVISLFQSFARYWLSPRLKRLSESAPEVKLQIRTERRLADFRRDGVDVAIRQGAGPWPGLRNERLFDEVVFPVCSPAFLAEHPLRTPADLLGAPLLDEDSPPWSRWFEAVGLAHPPRTPSTVFDDASIMLDAAISGLGVALARSFHAEPELKAGRLVRLFETEAVTPFAFHLVWREDVEPRPAVQAVLDFIRAEAAAGQP